MSQIFISYANEDKEFARRLAKAFEHEGWSVWWDKQIPPGMDYAHVIEQAVKAASCIVVLWSKYSIGSRWVQTEAAEGADRHIVATVIVDDTPGERIPFEFRRLQAVNLANWRTGETHAGFDSLAKRIRSILHEPPKPEPPPDDGKPVSWMEAMTRWGTGKQPVYRASALLAGLFSLVAGTEAVDTGDVDLLVGALILIAAAGYLLHFGRRPG